MILELALYQAIITQKPDLADSAVGKNKIALVSSIAQNRVYGKRIKATPKPIIRYSYKKNGVKDRIRKILDPRPQNA